MSEYLFAPTGRTAKLKSGTAISGALLLLSSAVCATDELAPEGPIVGRAWVLQTYSAPNSSEAQRNGLQGGVPPAAVFHLQFAPDSMRVGILGPCIDQTGSYELDRDGQHGQRSVVIRLDDPAGGQSCALSDPKAARQVRDAMTILVGHDLDESGATAAPLTYHAGSGSLLMRPADGRVMVFESSESIERRRPRLLMGSTPRADVKAEGDVLKRWRRTDGAPLSLDYPSDSGRPRRTSVTSGKEDISIPR